MLAQFLIFFSLTHLQHGQLALVRINLVGFFYDSSTIYIQIMNKYVKYYNFKMLISHFKNEIS